jgi:hypothetical protein
MYKSKISGSWIRSFQHRSLHSTKLPTTLNLGAVFILCNSGIGTRYLENYVQSWQYKIQIKGKMWKWNGKYECFSFNKNAREP